MEYEVNGYIQKKTGYPTDILKFSRELKNRKHPTQKPIALMEYLVKTYTDENEVVLDFTMGSGSTGVACNNLNRKFTSFNQAKKMSDYLLICNYKYFFDVKGKEKNYE